MVSSSQLAAIPLLRGLAATELGQIASFVTPMETPANTTLFAEGERDDRLCLIQSGLVEVTIHLPEGGERVVAQMGAGDTAGEIALLAGGRRAATVRTLTPTRGWLIDGQALTALRLDSRPGAIVLLERLGALALSRLRSTYESIATELGGDPEPPAAPVAGGTPIPHGALELEYLASLMCFARFERQAYVEDVLREVPARGVARGEPVLNDKIARDTLLLVARGAIEVSVRHTGAARRVRLVGPGRFVGHTGVLDDGPRLVVARARERSVLFEFPKRRVLDLLADSAPAGRRFAAALYGDVARAVRAAERPMAATLVAASDPAGGGMPAEGQPPPARARSTTR